MAGPQAHPPGYGQQPQVIYVQQPKGGGPFKGCMIVIIVLLVLGVLGTVAVVGVTYWGLGEANKLMNAETDAAKKVIDDFMAKLGTGDVKGALASCESDHITEEQLKMIYHAFEKVLKDNKGVTYEHQQVLNLSLAGQPVVVNNEWWVQFFPAKITGTDAKAHFVMHKEPGSTFKIQSFGVTGVKPEGDFKGDSIGSEHMPKVSSGTGN